MSKRRYRKISVCIWNDAKFMALSNDAKLIVFFMLTHPDLTQLGALRANVPGLACELGMELEAFTKGFQEVLTQGIVTHDGKLLIWFPNFLRYNLPESPNVVKSWHYGFRELPESALRTDILVGVKFLVDGLSQGFREAFRKTFAEELAHAFPNQRTESREQRTGEDKCVDDSPDVTSGLAESAGVIETAKTVGEDSQEEPAIPNCPYEKIKEAYNRICTRLPQCRDMTTQRKARVRAVWKSGNGKQFLEWWEGYFRLVRRSTFLAGDNDRGWTANFDWILKTANMVKIEEGTYLPKKGKTASLRGGASVSQRNNDVFESLMQE
ncbi:hypothetical protein [Halodesulfovibrio aestuarii]|uniref:hypothetical protein n=1 Tax=Halodesulfovibrio aestuarii TaxID=126333 RepID=UPI0004055F1D